MKLIIGGAYQGKLDYVLTNYNMNLANVIDGNECKLLSDSYNKDVKVIHNFQSYIKSRLEESINPLEEIKNFILNNQDIIIISDEIGYGIVPMTKFDREYREVVGRICCYVAKEADEVIRITCGIGRKIK